jgi:alanine racemase
MTDKASAPLALHLDSAALRANWQWLAKASGDARCAAAIKANGYGLGAVEVLHHLKAAGCRDFFVATWQEAAEVLPHLGEASLSVLHGVREEDMADALGSKARPVLNSAVQVARWKAAGGGACDVMIDTGMNRLRRYSLANSAGILLGADYAFDLTRPGLALYGGIARPEAAGHIAQVVRPRAQILQRRQLRAGESIGYGATFVADAPREVAILNIGYADGYLRGFSGRGGALLDGRRLPLLGRVSMDLVAIDVSNAPDLSDSDWLELEYDLPTAAVQSGLSQYELLTTMGRRYARVWR